MQMTVSQLLEKAARVHPDKEALYDRIRRLTYRELELQSKQIAAALASLGIQKGDRVGVCLPNWHETVAIYFAVAKIGAILVPFNPKYRTHEVQHILRNSGARLLFISEEFVREIGVDFISPWVKEIVSVRFEQEGLKSWTDLLAIGERAALPEVKIDPADDVFCILYTSGTTGFPKGAMLTHRGVVMSGISVGDRMECRSDDVFLIPTPLFHVFGLGPNLMAAVASQAKMVLMDKYNPQHALELIQQEKVTVHHAVPTMYILELNQPDLSSYDLSSLRVGMTGGAACPAETLKGIKEKMKMKVCIGYGMTEVGSLTNTLYEEEERNILETVGVALPGMEVRIVDQDRNPVSFGEVGEIACRGPSVMKGYFGEPEQTRQVLDEEGWFYTGDLGTMDERGYVRFVSRKKEMIIRGGYNIYPREIEELLYQHPKILEVAVIGVPDPVMGETVCAVIRLKAGMESTSEEITSFLKPLLAHYKVPNRVVFVEKFPTTTSGKIQKNKLREAIVEKMNV
jgi:fatty-acyl-CoA synthase